MIEQTKEKKNDAETYLYCMWTKLGDKYNELVTKLEREQFMSKFHDINDWLCEDGEHKTNGVYIEKLEEFKKQEDPIEECYKEHQGSGPMIDQHVNCMNSYKEATMINVPRFEILDSNERMGTRYLDDSY